MSKTQTEIMNAIMPHVVFAYVTTTGTVKGYKGGRPFKTGFPGLCDIIGMQPGGRLFGIEVKQVGEKITDVQLETIDNINKHGGTAGVAYNVEDALDILNKPIGDWS